MTQLSVSDDEKTKPTKSRTRKGREGDVWVGRLTVQYHGRGSTASEMKGESVSGRGHCKKKRSGVGWHSGKLSLTASKEDVSSEKVDRVDRFYGPPVDAAYISPVITVIIILT